MWEDIHDYAMSDLHAIVQQSCWANVHTASFLSENVSDIEG